jgi:hypothetical protein
MYHNELFLEAQKRPLPQQFPETFIGRLSPEIRENIHIASFWVQQAPQNNLHCGWREGQNPSPPLEWIKDHRPASISYRERRWPGTVQHLDEQPALLATFLPRAEPKAQSRLALLFTYRQVHAEAWHVYYSTNIFDLPNLAKVDPIPQRHWTNVVRS